MFFDFSHRRKQAVLGVRYGRTAVNRRCWVFGLPSTGSSGRCRVNLPKILDRPNSLEYLPQILARLKIMHRDSQPP